MDVMVTGASGFTGGHLARALRSRGHRVRALVRSPAKASELEARGIQVVIGDLTDPKAVRQAAEGCEVIYHIAALYREARHPDQLYRDVNVGGTGNVLDAAESASVARVVHCSTVGVHGNVPEVPANEATAFAPGDIYQVTKLEGELLARQRFSKGQAGVIFRPVAIFGPGDQRFLKLFKSIHRGVFRMIGSGDVLYQMTYIDDLVEGIMLCGEHPAAVGQTYILGGQQQYVTVRELAERIAKIAGRKLPTWSIPLAPVTFAATLCEAVCKPLGVEPPLHRRRLDFFRKDRAFSTEKVRSELGYVAKVDLDEGLRRTYHWYQQAGLL